MSRMSDLDQMLRELEARGFDASAHCDEGGIRVACTRCQAVVVNGAACHEHYCTNAMRECSGCNNLIPALRFRRFCEECM